ncbi:hypothetical protein BC940DRAFT_342586 [Gongronella butleri]|nr:hypothetical protein BC940DRAFT_342586 [Gongronella butleri]
MTLKRDLLLDELCPELLCGICHDLLDNPMQVHCSEGKRTWCCADAPQKKGALVTHFLPFFMIDHMFCYNCILRYDKSSCPSCLEALDKTSFQLSKFVKRQISRLRVKCPYHAQGCTWEGVLEDEHGQNCAFQAIPCPNASHGCTEKVSSGGLDAHRAQCAFEWLACPNQGDCKPFLRKDLAAHDMQCVNFRCKFQHEGCGFVGTLAQVNQHMDTYCGKLHDRIQELELTCQRLRAQLSQQDPTAASMDTLILPSHSSSIIPSHASPSQQQQQDPLPPPPPPPPQNALSPLDDMQILHQMFASNFFSDGPNDPVLPDASLFPNDLTNLSLTPFLGNSPIMPAAVTANASDTTPSAPPAPPAPPSQTASVPEKQVPQPSSTSTDKDQLDDARTTGSAAAQAAAAPKRSTNGKLIRYSKNKQLAHGAMRMARQRQGSNHGLTTEDILNALHVATNKGRVDDASSAASPQNQLAPPPPGVSPQSFAFKNLDDVTKFLEELPPIQEGSPFLSPHARKTASISIKSAPSTHRHKSDKRPKQQHHDTPPSTSQPMDISSPAPTDTPSSAAKPMFVLASSLLSKRNQE